MNTKIKIFIGFSIGAAVGVLSTWQYLSKKYNKIITEEVNVIREKANAQAKIYLPQEDNNPPKVKDPLSYSERLKKTSYDKCFPEILKNPEPKKEEEQLMTEKKIKSNPIVISPDEYGEEEDYDKISLTYYADKVLADEDDNRIRDVEGCVGIESLETFGKYEDDSVFVRNDYQHTYYEILLDLGTYEDIIRKKPYKKE